MGEPEPRLSPDRRFWIRMNEHQRPKESLLNKPQTEVKEMNGLFAVYGTEKNQEQQEKTMYNEKQIATGMSVSKIGAMTGEWEE